MAARLVTAADGVHVGPLFPRSLFNTVVLEGPEGDVVVDAGLPWSSRRLARYLAGRDVAEHVVTHAHGDHVGSTAWLCNHTGAPLAMSGIEADDFERGGSIAYHSSQRRMAELEPALVVSTHGHPIRGVERWSEGVRAAAR
jgi:hydroxyacylglutathione hydrolase